MRTIPDGIVARVFQYNRSAWMLAIMGLTVLPAGASCSNVARTEGDLSILSSQVQMFKARHGRLPTAEEGLEILVENKTGIPNWRRLLSEHVSDCWGKPYQYVIRPKLPSTCPHAQPDDLEFGLFSFGPDRMSATAGNDPDDINTWDRNKTFPFESPGQNWTLIGWAIALSCAWAGLLWRVWWLISAGGARRQRAFSTRP